MAGKICLYTSKRSKETGTIVPVSCFYVITDIIAKSYNYKNTYLFAMINFYL